MIGWQGDFSVGVAVLHVPRLKTVLLVLVMPLLVLLIGLIFAAARHAQEAARDGDCQSQLKQLGLALLNYHSTYGSFPAAFTRDREGKPMHSWRVAFLPIWESHELHGRYDFSVRWNHPNNAWLAAYDAPSYFFWCPSGNSRVTKMTDYIAVTGPETAWPGAECRKLEEIKDGPANTILVLETAGSGIPWMEPRDVSLEDLLDKGLRSNHAHHVHALFADGSV